MGETIRRTTSLCPICLKQIPAIYEDLDGEIYLSRTCPEHGLVSTIAWRNKVDFREWVGNLPELSSLENLKCPQNCGICTEHLQKTCCVILEVTSRCNLRCSFCFAGDKTGADPSFSELYEQLKQLIIPGQTLVQLTGGEPTVRDDLPDIVKAAKELGCRYVQLNSNGIRLANDLPYVQKLSKAGVSFVFMQFDGTNEKIYRQLRGKNLFEIKKRAIENCAKFNIGVTLVPTIVGGVNAEHIGDILDFAVSRSPSVRGVHFQPATYLGRTPENPNNDKRVTMDQLIMEIIEKSRGAVTLENLLPSKCDHPLCGFHGDFFVLPGGLKPLSARRNRTEERCCCAEPSAAEKSRLFVARRWERPETGCCDSSDPIDNDFMDMEQFLQRVKTHGFTITAMPFQDQWNMDIDRLRRCSLHVFKNGKKIPFCSYYMQS